VPEDFCNFVLKRWLVYHAQTHFWTYKLFVEDVVNIFSTERALRSTKVDWRWLVIIGERGK